MKIKYIILSLIILLIPTFVKASDVDYEITNYYIDSYILENGDLEIKELIVLNGSFNGYIRELATSNSVLSSSNKIDFEHDAIYNAFYDVFKDFTSKNVSFMGKANMLNQPEFSNLETIKKIYSKQYINNQMIIYFWRDFI